MVAIRVPSTLFGLSIGAAVLMHEGSTVVVVFNALRLLAYRSPGIAGDEEIPRPDHSTHEHPPLTG